LPCSGNLDIAEEGDTTMKKIAVILALAFAITTGMAVCAEILIRFI